MTDRPPTPRERADAIAQARDLSWQEQRDLIQRHIEEAEREALRSLGRSIAARAGAEAAVEVDPLAEVEA